MAHWFGETCKFCGRPYRLGYVVSDKLWCKVVPRNLQNGTLCIDCFDNLAKDRGITYQAIIAWAGYGSLVAGDNIITKE